MGQLIDIYGNPLSKSTLKEQQSETDAMLRMQWAEHPSKGVTVQRLYAMFREAEQGYLTRQSDFFTDMEERDGHIFAELSKRRRAVMSLDWSIVPPRNATAREKDMAAAAAEWFEDLPDFETLIFDMLDAIGHGFSPVEIEWERADNTWLPKAFHKRPQRWFQTPQYDGNSIRLIDGSLDGATLQPFGWVLHKHRAKSGWLAESGLFRVLAWPYLFKNLSARDLAEFLEIYGLPMRVGKYPAGSTEDQKMALMHAIIDLGHNAGGIMPDGMTIDFQSAAEGQVDPFSYMIDWCERTQSKVILGATLTSQADGKSSTNALGNVHNEVRHDLMASDAIQLASTLTRELLYPLFVLNGYGDITPRRMCRFEFDTSEPEDLTATAEAIDKLVTAGMPVGVKWARQKTRIPEPEKGEAILVKSQMTPFGGPQPVGLSLAALAQVNSQVSITQEQDAIDGAPDTLASAVGKAMTVMLKPVLDALASGQSPDEARAALSDAYPNVNAEEMEQLIAQAIFVADIWGRLNAG
jgi:phage gp29-like protein